MFIYVFSHGIKRNKKEHNPQVSFEDAFEKLQGSETDSWYYIQTERDHQDLERYKELYNKNYHHQFNFNPGFKIPKTVHLIWLGPKPFPSECVENIRTWVAHHPDWVFNFWTDRKRFPPCNGMKVHLLGDFNFEFLKEQFEESENWEEKAAIWCYEILYQKGGLYIDHNVTCIRPFHALHTGYDFYTGLEMPHEEIDSLALTIGTAIFGAKEDE